MLFCFVDIVSSTSGKFIHSLNDNEYKTILKLCKKEFSVPVEERSKEEKAAIIKFWRHKGKFTNDGDTLLYDGKKV